LRKVVLILSILFFFLSLIFLRHHFSVYYFQNDIGRLALNIESQNVGDIYVCFDKNCDLMKFEKNIYSYELNQENPLFYNDSIENIEFILPSKKAKNNFESISFFYNLDEFFYLSNDDIKNAEIKEIDFQATVALSLHAPNHEIRQKIMPIENKYRVEEVIEALKDLVDATGRRATIEYTIIKGVNDSLEQAKEMLALLKGLHCNINIIPYNNACNASFEKPTEEHINKFKFILERSSYKVTVRLERGADIDAACGQLSGKAKNV